MQKIVEIPVGKIEAGEHEQRLDIEDEELDGLVSSISRVGLVYPCIVVSRGDKFILLEGHRRLAACKRLGKQTIGCLVRDSKETAAAEVAFAGNFFRKDLSPVELACAIKDAYVKATLTVKELAAGFHRSEHWVQRMMAVADWPVDILEAVHNESISVSAAANLAVVTDDTYRRFLVSNAVESGATARTTASWLQAWRAMQPASEAITSEPVKGDSRGQPVIPQAPCLCCAQIFPANEMSHVPVCGGCIQIIRRVGSTGWEQVIDES